MPGCRGRQGRRRRMRNRIKIQIKARRKNNDCAHRGGSQGAEGAGAGGSVHGGRRRMEIYEYAVIAGMDQKSG